MRPIMRIRAAIIGAALGALAAVVVHYPLTESARLALALFLALTACIYLGALLAQKQTVLTAFGELLVGTGVFVCSFLGIVSSASWLAAGRIVITIVYCGPDPNRMMHRGTHGS